MQSQGWTSQLAKQKQNIPLCFTGILILCIQSIQSEACSFGATNIGSQRASYIIPGQYLDLNNTIPCSGYVTSIQFCHNNTNSSQSSNITSTFHIRIWREAKNTYFKVEEFVVDDAIMSQVEASLIDDILCRMLMIGASKSFQVLSGDVVGVYFENPSLGLLTTNTMPEATGTGRLYFDTRPMSDVLDETTITSSDLRIIEPGLEYHLQLQIGFEMTSTRPPTSIVPSQTSKLTVSFEPHASSLTTSLKFIMSSSQHVTPASAQTHTRMETQLTFSPPNSTSVMVLNHSGSISMPTSSISLESKPALTQSDYQTFTTSFLQFSSSSLISLKPTTTLLQSIGTIAVSPSQATTMLPSPTASSQFVSPASNMMPTISATPRHPSDSTLSVPTLIAGVSVLCVLVVVVFIVIVIVVCVVMTRSRKTDFLEESSTGTAFSLKNNLLIMDNPSYDAPPDVGTAAFNEVDDRDSTLPTTQIGSQGTLSETVIELSNTKDLSDVTPTQNNILENRLPIRPNKHTSVHIYNTIETIQRELPPHMKESSMRSLSEIHDYADIELTPDISSVSTSALQSTESLSTTITTTSSPPTEYLVPLSVSASSRSSSSDCTLRSDSSLSSGSWQEPIVSQSLSESTYIAMDSDFDLWRKHNERLEMQLFQLKRTESRSRGSMDGPYCCPPTDLSELHRKLKELSVEMISTRDIQAHLGVLQPSLQSQKAVLRRKSVQADREVTIKSPYPASKDAVSMREAKTHLLREAAIMGQIRHPNVVQLHGVIMEDDKVMLVMEQFPKEDLRRYLVQMGRSVIPPDAPKLLLSFSQQVALGMHYLSSKGFVHRDLAARSIYVTKNDICKVGELAKCLEYSNPEQYVINGGKLPIRWMAPEAMYRQRYSTASDVWSYGCLLYEIWSLGRMPFREYTNAEVIEKVDSGYRIPPPPGCPRLIYELMIQCWHPHPLSRPTFKDLINSLLKDETQTLQVPIKDAATHESAIILGAELEAGKFLYRDLQMRYLEKREKKSQVSLQSSNGSSPTILSRQNSDYDHISDQKVMVTAFPTSSADIDHMYKGRKGQKSTGAGNGVDSSVDSDFNSTVTTFRQRLLTNEKSDYTDTSD